MQFQTFPEKESRPGRKTAGAPQLPYETGSVKIQRAFLTSAHLLEAQYSGGKGDTQVFFIGTMFLFNGNSIVFLFHFDNIGTGGMVIVIVMKSSSGKQFIREPLQVFRFRNIQ